MVIESTNTKSKISKIMDWPRKPFSMVQLNLMEKTRTKKKFLHEKARFLPDESILLELAIISEISQISFFIRFLSWDSEYRAFEHLTIVIFQHWQLNMIIRSMWNFILGHSHRRSWKSSEYRKIFNSDVDINTVNVWAQ